MHYDKQPKENDHALTFSVTIPKNEIPPYFDKAAIRLGKHIQLPGYRKGKAPKEVILQEVAFDHITSEALRLLIAETFYNILKQEELEEFLGKPDYNINDQELDGDKDFSFSFTVYLPTEVELPDYHALTITPPTPTVTEDEIAERQEKAYNLLLNYHKIQARQNSIANQSLPADPNPDEDKTPEDKTSEDKAIVESTEDDKTKTPDPTLEQLLEKHASISIEEHKKNIKRHLYKEKSKKIAPEFLETIIETLLKQATITVNSKAVSSALDELRHDLQELLDKYNLDFPEFLSKINKTKEEFEQEQQETAEKLAKENALLDSIAEKEGIQALAREIRNQKEEVLSSYYIKDGKKRKLSARGKEISRKLNNPHATDYFTKKIVRQKTRQFLLEQHLPDDYGTLPEDLVEEA